MLSNVALLLPFFLQLPCFRREIQKNTCPVIVIIFIQEGMPVVAESTCPARSRECHRVKELMVRAFLLFPEADMPACLHHSAA